MDIHNIIAKNGEKLSDIKNSEEINNLMIEVYEAYWRVVSAEKTWQNQAGSSSTVKCLIIGSSFTITYPLVIDSLRSYTFLIAAAT